MIRIEKKKKSLQQHKYEVKTVLKNYAKLRMKKEIEIKKRNLNEEQKQKALELFHLDFYNKTNIFYKNLEARLEAQRKAKQKK